MRVPGSKAYWVKDFACGCRCQFREFDGPEYPIEVQMDYAQKCASHTDETPLVIVYGKVRRLDPGDGFNGTIYGPPLVSASKVETRIQG